MGLASPERTPDLQFFITLLDFVTKLVEIMIKSGCRLRLWGHTQICGGGCGIAWDTWCSGCAIAMVLLSVHSCFRQFCGGHALDTACPKRINLFANVTSLKGAVMSYMTSQCCVCIGHMTFYYKRPTNTSVGVLACCSSICQV